MKTMKLLPLKIAVTSAMIIGLGATSTANAQQQQQQQQQSRTEIFFPNIFFNENHDTLDDVYHNMILGDTALLDQDGSQPQLKFYSNDKDSVPDSLLFSKLLHEQQLNGFKEGDTIIPLDENGKPVYKLDEKLENGVKKSVYSVTTKIATRDDVEQSAYSRGIQGDIDDLYEANTENVNRLIEHGDKIFANEESVQYLNKEVQNNIENIYELAQQQDQHSSDIKTLKKNVEEELLNLSGRLTDQKADIAQNQTDIQDLAAYNELQDQYAQKQTEAIDALNKASSENTQNIAKNSNRIKTLENNVEEGLLELSGHLIDQKADLTKDIKTLESNVEEGLLDLSGRLLDQKADIAQNQANIQDLAAYNELQDQYAQKQTEAIDALNKASSENTQNIEDLAAYNELQDAYAKQQTEAIDALNKASSENTQNIAKNQADIANNINNIYELAQQQDQHSSDIKTLAKVSAANTDRIAKNKAEADASFETLTKNQNTLIEQGEALVEQNKAINQELEGFAAHADVQDKQILQNQADITTNKTAIEQNINRTVANGFEIEKNKAGIATNKQELILQNDRLNRINETNNRQDQKIDQLGYALKEQGQHFNNRISAVERQTAGGIANAIAIATLPSPSRAGEHHVLFGSGYHNGQAAVSLGAAGLSDTGKSTYKIGLSWSDAGGLSGGVGGSYRWK